MFDPYMQGRGLWTPPSMRRPAWVQRESAGKLSEMLPQNQTATMQTRLQRLRFHAENRARLFRRESLDIAQYDRNAIHLRQMGERLDQTLAQLRAHHLIVCP